MSTPALKAVTRPPYYEEQLVEQYLGAQANLRVAQKILANAEQAILEHFGHKDEGTMSVHVADKYKVSTVGKINRTVSAEVWDEVKGSIPESLADRLVRYKPELNLRELRYVELNEPEWFASIAKAITSKPAKPSVKIDVVEG